MTFSVQGVKILACEWALLHILHVQSMVTCIKCCKQHICVNLYTCNGYICKMLQTNDLLTWWCNVALLPFLLEFFDANWLKHFAERVEGNVSLL